MNDEDFSFQHFPYEKIAESANEWNFTPDEWKKLRKIDWVVTEKVHGANFCILTDGAKVQCAKRKQLLTDQDKFYGFNQILPQIEPKIKELCQLSKNSIDCDQISIYGEIFGGGYPHSKVDVVPNVHLVQTGVFYSPDVNFMVFDILATKFNKDIKTRVEYRKYLDYDQMKDLCESVNLFYAKCLFKGSYEQCLNFNIRFDSTIPQLLGLPKMADQINLAEGVVVKMASSLSLVKGSPQLVRLAVKRKIVEFDEVDEYHLAQKWENNSDCLADNEIVILSFATDNRMKSVLSHLGSVKEVEASSKLESEVLAHFVEDVFESFYSHVFDKRGGEPTVNCCSYVDEFQLRPVVEKRARELLDKMLSRNA